MSRDYPNLKLPKHIYNLHSTGPAGRLVFCYSLWLFLCIGYYSFVYRLIHFVYINSYKSLCNYINYKVRFSFDFKTEARCSQQQSIVLVVCIRPGGRHTDRSFAGQGVPNQFLDRILFFFVVRVSFSV